MQYVQTFPMQTKSSMHTLFITLMGSLFIALCTQIKIFLPFTPVPFTGQVLAILFLGASLGSKQAAAATLLYLFEGLAGLPFFTRSLAFMGPTAGYLYAMPLMAYIAGKVSIQKSLMANLAILASATLLLLVAGTSYLAVSVGWSTALTLGFFPFLAGDALKVMIVAFCLQRGSLFKNSCNLS
jgi:biotin transport system substrate-specific component